MSLYDAKVVLALAKQACEGSRKVTYTNDSRTPQSLVVESVVCVRVPCHARVLHQGPTYDLVVASGHTPQRLTHAEWCQVFAQPAEDCMPYIMCMYGIDPRHPKVVCDYIQVVHPDEPWRVSGWIKLSELEQKIGGI